MKRMTPARLMLLGAALLLSAPSALGQERSDAVLVLADDGALDDSAVHAIRNIAASELRKHGVVLAEDRRTAGVHPLDAELSTLALDLGARRVFALRIGGRLGQKIPLSLDELTPETLMPVHSASLTATESKPFAKKPGERFWFVGLPVALYNAGNTPTGFSLGYGYEAENFRISVTGAGYSRGSDGVAYVAMEAAWIPFATEISPYIGGGFGYMGAGGHGGLGGVIEGGLEAFRLHGVRALLGVQLAVPFFDTQENSGVTAIAHRGVYPAGFVRLAF